MHPKRENGANKLEDYFGGHIISHYNLDVKRLVKNNIWENGL